MFGDTFIKYYTICILFFLLDIQWPLYLGLPVSITKDITDWITDRHMTCIWLKPDLAFFLSVLSAYQRSILTFWSFLLCCPALASFAVGYAPTAGKPTDKSAWLIGCILIAQSRGSEAEKSASRNHNGTSETAFTYTTIHFTNKHPGLKPVLHIGTQFLISSKSCAATFVMHHEEFISFT